MNFFQKLFNRPPRPGKPLPVTDDTFEADVLKSKIPIVVDFWSPTCAPCQVMAGLLNELGPQFAGRVNIYKLNVNENPSTATRFRIMSVPTIILFKQGKIVDLFSGLLPLNPLKEKLEQIAG